MKYIRILSFSLLFTSIFGISLRANAMSPVGLLSDFNGDVFVKRGASYVGAEKGMHLYENEEVIVEIGSYAQFIDYSDRLFNISGATSIEILRNKAVLKKGMLWIQLNKKVETIVETSNSRVFMNEGEGVLSFNPSNQVSQFVSVDGVARLSNLSIKEFETYISPGSFSVVSSKEDMGRPRPQSTIGENSYKKIRNLFSFVDPIREPIKDMDFKLRKIRIKREIASEKVSIKNKIDEIKDEKRQKLALEKGLQKYRKKVVNYKYPKAPINIFYRSPPEKKLRRKPASEAAPKPSAFRQDLFKEYRKQKRYDEATRQLARELESFKMDFFESY